MSWWLTLEPRPAHTSFWPFCQVTQVPHGKHCICTAQRADVFIVACQKQVYCEPWGFKELFLTRSLRVLVLAYSYEALLKAEKLIFTHPHIISCNLLLVGLLKCDQT